VFAPVMRHGRLFARGTDAGGGEFPMIPAYACKNGYRKAVTPGLLYAEGWVVRRSAEANPSGRGQGPRRQQASRGTNVSLKTASSKSALCSGQRRSRQDKQPGAFVQSGPTAYVTNRYLLVSSVTWAETDP
jgi:hypothetical protein